MPELSHAARDLLLAVYRGADLRRGYNIHSERREVEWWLDGSMLESHAGPQELLDADLLQKRPLGEASMAKSSGHAVLLSPKGQAEAARLQAAERG
jgi:hypothetical protein